MDTTKRVESVWRAHTTGALRISVEHQYGQTVKLLCKWKLVATHIENTANLWNREIEILNTPGLGNKKFGSFMKQNGLKVTWKIKMERDNGETISWKRWLSLNCSSRCRY